MTRVLQLSDIHFGAEDPAALDLVEDLVQDLGADLLAVCGDLTQHGRRREFQRAAAWLRAFDLPLVCVPGNHDTPVLDLGRRVFAPFARFRRAFPDLPEQVHVKDLRAYTLATARGWQLRRNWAEGAVDLRELDAVLKLAQGEDRSGCACHADTAAETAPLSVLVCHHPLLPPPSAPLPTATRRGESAAARIAASPIQLVLTGHVHAPSAVWHRLPAGLPDGPGRALADWLAKLGGRADARGAGQGSGPDQGPERSPPARYLAVNSGTLSARLRGEPPSFNILEIHPDRLEAIAVALVHGTPRHLALGCWRRCGARLLPDAFQPDDRIAVSGGYCPGDRAPARSP